MAAHPKRLIRLCLVAVGLACGAGLVSAQTAPDARRIVSLVPALTEMLYALGAGPQVVGVSSYDVFPPQVTSLPRVGALLDPDMERILSLRPDLVISYGSQAEIQGQLTRTGIRVFTYRHAGLQGIMATIRDLGATVGRAAEGERLARDIRAQLDRIHARVGGRERPRAVVVFERDPASLRGMYVSGGVGFLHDLLELAGGVNAFADVQRESVQPSIETLLERAPDVILEVRATGLLAPADLAGARDSWKALGSVPAVRRERIHILNGEYLVVPGPRVVQAAEAFARALHPEAVR
jgi:iron complex transport system substrate-binding protein